jgi:hypothetical protein
MNTFYLKTLDKIYEMYFFTLPIPIANNLLAFQDLIADKNSKN